MDGRMGGWMGGCEDRRLRRMGGMAKMDAKMGGWEDGRMGGWM